MTEHNNPDTSGARIKRQLRSLEPRERTIMLLALTWVAGTIDAISYFELGRVFTANMTGNTVLLGLALGQGQVLGALRSAAALFGFCAGAFAGAVVVGRDRKKGEWPPALTAAVGIELILVGIFTITSRIAGIELTGVVVYMLIALFGVAMGIQSAAVRHLDIAGVATTYMTGTLTSLMAGLIGWVGPADISSAREGGTKLLGTVYAIYILAAIAGAFVESHTQHWAVLMPLGALIFVVAYGSLRHYQKV